MNTKLIGDVKPDESALSQMRIGQKMYPGVRYAAYQNRDLGHVDLGHLKFLATGPNNTLKTAPPRFPDTAFAINWRYVHVGWVNIEEGTITED